MNIVVACCKNRGIGFNNTLPWKIKNELNFFKYLTIGNGNNAVVMGKNTWLSLKKPLPKRTNFVLSKTLSKKELPDNVHLITSIESIENLYRINQYSNMWIIGGENLYNSMINSNYLDSIFYTDINKNYKCDTFFPEISHDNFSLIFKSKVNEELDNCGDNVEYTYNIFQKKNNIEKTNPIALIKETKNKIDYDKYKKYYKKQCKLYV